MKKVTIKQYAQKHKLSIFNVTKLLKSGKLNTIVEEVEGKDVTYILLDHEIENEVKKGIVPHHENENTTVKEEIEQLKEELNRLKKEIEVLKKAMEK